MNTEPFNAIDILSMLPQGILIADSTGSVIYANSPIQKLYGLTKEQIIRNTISHIFRDAHLEGIFSEEPVNIYIHNTVVSVQKFTYHSRNSENSTSLSLYVLIPQEDVTREIHTLLSMMSLEVRGPLSVVQGNTEVLTRGLVGEVNDEQRHFLQSTQSHVENIIAVFNQLLIFTHIETGIMTYQPSLFRVSHVVESVIQRISRSLIKKNISLTQVSVVELGEAYADEDHIRHLLLQVINNAIFFSNTGQEIVISGRRETNMVWVEVIDRGIGIPERDQAFLYNRHHFIQRTVQPSPHRISLRLGLHIVQKLAKQNNIAVNIQSIENTGTHVSIGIPVKKAI